MHIYIIAVYKQRSYHARETGAFALGSRVAITGSHKAGKREGGVGRLVSLTSRLTRLIRTQHTRYAGASETITIERTPKPNTWPLPAKMEHHISCTRVELRPHVSHVVNGTVLTVAQSANLRCLHKGGGLVSENLRVGKPHAGSNCMFSKAFTSVGTRYPTAGLCHHTALWWAKNKPQLWLE